MRRPRVLYAIGLFLCLLIAGMASFYASGSPDGLEKVAEDTGFQDTTEEHALADWPLAEYATRGIDNARLSGGVAGVAGVCVTLVVAGGLFLVLARRGGTGTAPETESCDATGQPPAAKT